MKELSCSFTGHRKIPREELFSLQEKLKAEIVSLIEKGISTFITGGALGFDTLAAVVVFGLKREYPHIKLHLILPCVDQDKLWSENDKALYRDILRDADAVQYICDTYRDGCMLDRNRRMIDSSSVCIAYYNGRPRSGTAMTVSYAKKKGLRVINLY